MCKIFNSIGSLTTLKLRLKESNIHDFNSLKEVMDFQKTYTQIRHQLISEHKKLIEQEKNNLYLELQKLNTDIEAQKQQSVQKLTNEINELKEQLNTLKNNSKKSFFHKLFNFFRNWKYKKEILKKENNFDVDVNLSVCSLVEDFQRKNNRYDFVNSNFDEAVNQSVQLSISELDRKKKTIDDLNSYIYGALGEHKIVKILETLSDEYYLINDFNVSFYPAVYNKIEKEYIKSVQIDHILVAPSGIFLIETKNWSEKSLENLSLRSPVAQIRRANYALFYMINKEINRNYLNLESHHWGDKKIPIKNLIVLTNSKPKEEFQYVKILTSNELLGYVKYFEPIFSSIETKMIADLFLRINNN